MMDKIIVKGGQTKLQGEVEIEGAKNAVLPLLAATLLASEGEVVLTNVPILSDVFMMNNLVNHLGTAISFDQEAKKIIAKSNSEIKTTAPYEYVSKNACLNRCYGTNLSPQRTSTCINARWMFHWISTN